MLFLWAVHKYKIIVTIQPLGFIATKACTQTVKTAVRRMAASGFLANARQHLAGQWKAELLQIIYFAVFFLDIGQRYHRCIQHLVECSVFCCQCFGYGFYLL